MSLSSIQEEEIQKIGEAETEIAVVDPEIERQKNEARDILAKFMTDVDLNLGNDSLEGRGCGFRP